MCHEKNHSLKIIKGILVNSKLSENDISRMLTEMRNVLEYDGEKMNYRMLYFYCNWASHSLIDREDLLFEILDKINIGFSEIFLPNSDTNREFKDYGEIIKDTIDFKPLENNLRNFFAESGIKDIPYKKLVFLICKNVIEKKVQYPNGDKGLKKRHKELILNRKSVVKANKLEVNRTFKFNNPKLAVDIDYSKMYTIKSFKFIAV